MKSLKKKNSAFATWVMERGIKSVAYDLRVCSRTVQYWLTGDIDPPTWQIRRIKKASGGLLSYDDIIDRAYLTRRRAGGGVLR